MRPLAAHALGSDMKAIIVGGGVGGLTTALMLHARGIDCEVYEQGEQIRELGVGINTLPHAIKELAELGLLQRLDDVAIRTYELFYTNRFGQEIWREPRGTDAGFDYPQFSIHRGRLQAVIYQAVRARLGESRIHTGHRLGAFAQDDTGLTGYFFDRTGAHRASARGDVLIGADGINSRVREILFPNEGAARWNGIMLWRGALDWPAFLTGRSMIVAGGMAAKCVVYPIAEGSRADRRLTNWAVAAKIGDETTPMPHKEDWSRPGRMEELQQHLALFRIPVRRRAPPDRGDTGVLGIPDVRPRSAAALVARARDAARRRRASDVPGRLQRRLAGDPRCARARRSAGRGRAPVPRAVGLRAGAPADDRTDRAHEPQGRAGRRDRRGGGARARRLHRHRCHPVA